MSRASVQADLYVCDPCTMIGPVTAAMAHERNTGHPTRRLSLSETLGIREIWEVEERCLLCGSFKHTTEGCGE